ncbi:plant/T7N9-9 protein [Senna tora]|uniref:2-oxoadipate dioxygenase/decarboxylase n=1 Tax=Senna tora TaxID=362788 RepID=A0A834WNY2_9FABA|nr:plant/T7N9-9 protein [Senna tora]
MVMLQKVKVVPESSLYQCFARFQCCHHTCIICCILVFGQVNGSLSHDGCCHIFLPILLLLFSQFLEPCRVAYELEATLPCVTILLTIIIVFCQLVIFLVFAPFEALISVSTVTTIANALFTEGSDRVTPLSQRSQILLELVEFGATFDSIPFFQLSPKFSRGPGKHKRFCKILRHRVSYPRFYHRVHRLPHLELGFIIGLLYCSIYKIQLIFCLQSSLYRQTPGDKVASYQWRGYEGHAYLFDCLPEISPKVFEFAVLQFLQSSWIKFRSLERKALIPSYNPKDLMQKVNGYGIDSMASFFLDYGYTTQEELRFPAKKLKALWFSPPQDSFAGSGSGIHGPLPRIFISELLVDQMSPQTQEIIRKYTGTSGNGNKYAAIASCLGISTWEKPLYSEYQQLASESEYAAWTVTNGYALNHVTISTHRLKSHLRNIKNLNQFIEDNNIRLNSEGGVLKVSPDGLLLQSSTVADSIPFQFSDGITKSVPCSYIEFAERLVLHQYRNLPETEISNVMLVFMSLNRLRSFIGGTVLRLEMLTRSLKAHPRCSKAEQAHKKADPSPETLWRKRMALYFTLELECSVYSAPTLYLGSELC